MYISSHSVPNHIDDWQRLVTFVEHVWSCTCATSFWLLICSTNYFVNSSPSLSPLSFSVVLSTSLHLQQYPISTTSNLVRRCATIPMYHIKQPQASSLTRSIQFFTRKGARTIRSRTMDFTLVLVRFRSLWSDNWGEFDSKLISWDKSDLQA